MSEAPLYRAVFVLVHWLFTIFQWLLDGLKEKGGAFVGTSHGFDDCKVMHDLRTEIAKKNKIPRHLTVLLGKEEPSYPDLANIVLWSIVNHISFLSFYDYQGTLWKNQHKLEAAVNEKVSPKDHVIWYGRASMYHKTNGNDPNARCKNENGKVFAPFTGRKIHIKIISPDNGRQSIVRLARVFRQSNQSASCSIDNVDDILQRYFQFPDPDLGLICGKFLRLLHYPPWQIRVTEFLSIKSHHRIKYKTFLEQLIIFANCEQRLGT